jgi:ribosomal protein L11 methyltransferase
MSNWQASFTLTHDAWEISEALLSDFFPALTVKPIIDNDPSSDQIVTLIYEDKPDDNELKSQLSTLFDMVGLPVPIFTLETLPDIDWLQHVYDSLKPIEAGRFFVYGKHIKDNIPTDKVTIVIEAASAFGTGEHPTTKGCLMMLDRYLNTNHPKKILDMGAGSGILSIALAKVVLDTTTVLGVDIHDESVRVANSHAADNNLANRVHYIHGDGFYTADVKTHAPYDLVFGNILAQPLIEMAPQFCAVSAKDLILSGFTDAQQSYVEKPYLENGFSIEQQLNLEGWMTLWLRKK